MKIIKLSKIQTGFTRDSENKVKGIFTDPAAVISQIISLGRLHSCEKVESPAFKVFDSPEELLRASKIRGKFCLVDLEETAEAAVELSEESFALLRKIIMGCTALGAQDIVVLDLLDQAETIEK